MEKVIFIWIFALFSLSHPMSSESCHNNFPSMFCSILHFTASLPTLVDDSFPYHPWLWYYKVIYFFPICVLAPHFLAAHPLLSPSSLWRCLETKLKFHRHRLALCLQWDSLCTAKHVMLHRWWMKTRSTVTTMTLMVITLTSGPCLSGSASSSWSATLLAELFSSELGRNGISSMPLTSASLRSQQSVSWVVGGSCGMKNFVAGF